MAKYKAKYKGIGDMLTSRGMVTEMYNRANKVKVVAEATAPVGNYAGGGEYAASFEVESGIRAQGNDRRAYGRVTNTDEKALWLELGTGDTPRFRTLGNALSAAEE